MIKTVKIPEDRMPVLIGTKGATKRLIEKKTGTKILISEDVNIEGESINILSAENIVRAIGRGFSPEVALLLTDEETTISIIELPKNEKATKRIRSRLIGTGGKSRRNLERLTKTYISVYGKTVAIIGKYNNVSIAENAINEIIKGVSHRSVYQNLEEKQDAIE